MNIRRRHHVLRRTADRCGRSCSQRRCPPPSHWCSRPPRRLSPSVFATMTTDARTPGYRTTWPRSPRLDVTISGEDPRFRIELGEIEARLSEYPGVRASVVNCSRRHSGDKRLVAYYTSVTEEDTVAAEQLRPHLSLFYRQYMCRRRMFIWRYCAHTQRQARP